MLSRRTIDADVRHYTRLGSTGLLATRLRGFTSNGDFPDFMYFGGNGDLRGYDYLQFVGQNVMYANAELRFPLIEAALTPIGVIGGIRGVFFAGIGGAWFDGQKTANPCTGEQNTFKFMTNSDKLCQVVTGYKIDALGQPIFITDPVTGLQAPAHNYHREAGHGLPAGGRPRLVRHRARNVCARLPHSLRLVVAHARQSRLGERRLFLRGRHSQRRVRQRRAKSSGNHASRSGLDTISDQSR